MILNLQTITTLSYLYLPSTTRKYAEKYAAYMQHMQHNMQHMCRIFCQIAHILSKEVPHILRKFSAINQHPYRADLAEIVVAQFANGTSPNLHFLWAKCSSWCLSKPIFYRHQTKGISDNWNYCTTPYIGYITEWQLPWVKSRFVLNVTQNRHELLSGKHWSGNTGNSTLAKQLITLLICSANAQDNLHNANHITNVIKPAATGQWMYWIYKEATVSLIT